MKTTAVSVARNSVITIMMMQPTAPASEIHQRDLNEGR